MRKILMILMCLLMLVKNVEAADESFGVVDIMSRVDITNLDNKRVEMFHIVTDFLVTKLQREIPNIYVDDVTPEATKARLDEVYLQLNQGNCAEFKDSNCDYIIYGYLMNLTVSEGRRLAEKSEAVRADLSIRIVDVNTGKCVYAVVGTGISKAREYKVFKYTIQGSQFSEEELHSALKEATDDIVKKLKKNIN